MKQLLKRQQTVLFSAVFGVFLTILVLAFFAVPNASAQAARPADPGEICKIKIDKAKCVRAVQECNKKVPANRQNCIDLNTAVTILPPVYSVCRTASNPQSCHTQVAEACMGNRTTEELLACRSQQAAGIDSSGAISGGILAAKGDKLYQCGNGDNAVKTRFNFGCKGNSLPMGTGPIVDLAYALIRFLSFGVGLVLAASIIYAGIQYSSSSGNPEATSAAKKRILNALIALIFYLLIFAFIQFLVPGGLFKPN